MVMLMKFSETRLYHGLTGNATKPTVTGWTRGAVVSAVVAFTNMLVLLLPLAAVTQATILTGIVPGVILFSFVLFGYLDMKFSKYTGEEDGD